MARGLAAGDRGVLLINPEDGIAFPVAEAAPTGGGFLHSSPMSTFAGLSYVYQPMRMGLRTLYLPKFDVLKWLDIVEAERPPMVFLVPAMVELLLAAPDQDRLHSADLSG